MASTNPLFADDKVLQVNDGASNAFVDIDDVQNLTEPTVSRPHVDRPLINSAGRVNRKAGNRIDYGSFSFTVEMKGSTQERFDNLLMPDSPAYTPGGADPREWTWKFLRADGSSDSFKGSIESMAPAQSSAGGIEARTITVVLQSVITRAYTAATSIPINPDTP